MTDKSDQIWTTYWSNVMLTVVVLFTLRHAGVVNMSLVWVTAPWWISLGLFIVIGLLQVAIEATIKLFKGGR